MRDVNQVVLTGKLDSVTRLTAKPKYAYLNLVVEGMDVVISLGGKKYSIDMANGLEQFLRNTPDVHVDISGGSFISPKRQSDNRPAGWEISCKHEDFVTSVYPIRSLKFAMIRGRILQIAPDPQGMAWADVSCSYFSKNPNDSNDKGSYKSRVIKVLLDKAWGQETVNHFISLTGRLSGTTQDGKRFLHVITEESVVL